MRFKNHIRHGHRSFLLFGSLIALLTIAFIVSRTFAQQAAITLNSGDSLQLNCQASELSFIFESNKEVETSCKSGENSADALPIVVAGDGQIHPIPAGTEFILQAPRGPEWQIAYDAELLTLLTPPEEQTQIGNDWEFRANETIGVTRIWLTKSPPPCNQDPCPPGAAALLEAAVNIIQE